MRLERERPVVNSSYFMAVTGEGLSGAEVKEKVDLYFYSLSLLSWHVMGRNFNLLGIILGYEIHARKCHSDVVLSIYPQL